MGNMKPAELVNLPYRKELNKIQSLLNKLPENLGLQGNAERLAALRTATAAFEPLVDADEAATRDMLNKGKVLGTALETPSCSEGTPRRRSDLRHPPPLHPFRTRRPTRPRDSAHPAGVIIVTTVTG
jgi:hypothetical protein